MTGFYSEMYVYSSTGLYDPIRPSERRPTKWFHINLKRYTKEGQPTDRLCIKLCLLNTNKTDIT
jgi:hypothetical protein